MARKKTLKLNDQQRRYLDMLKSFIETARLTKESNLMSIDAMSRIVQSTFPLSEDTGSWIMNEMNHVIRMYDIPKGKKLKIIPEEYNDFLTWGLN